MKRKTYLSHAELKERLTYYPSTGIFIWTNSPKNSSKSRLTVAGTVLTNTNQRIITIKNERWPASHLAIYWMEGKVITGQVRYKNGDCSNTSYTNLQKLESRSNGEKGLHWHGSCFRVKKNKQVLGYVNSVEEGKVLLGVDQ